MGWSCNPAVSNLSGLADRQKQQQGEREWLCVHAPLSQMQSHAHTCSPLRCLSSEHTMVQHWAMAQGLGGPDVTNSILHFLQCLLGKQWSLLSGQFCWKVEVTANFWQNSCKVRIHDCSVEHPRCSQMTRGRGATVRILVSALFQKVCNFKRLLSKL